MPTFSGNRVRFLLFSRGAYFRLSIPCEHADVLSKFLAQIDENENEDSVSDWQWPVAGKLSENSVVCFKI